MEDDIIFLTCRPERALAFSVQLLEGMQEEAQSDPCDKNKYLVHMQQNVVQLLKFALNHLKTVPATPTINPSKIKS